jgi:NTE family protein
MTAGTRTKVAVACQGGGSKTAFTAGALRRVLRDPGLDRDFELVALSGTSGGALCCLLAWYGLLAGPPEGPERGDLAVELLDRFWAANSAHEWWDLWVANPFIVGVRRLVDAGLLPATPPPPWVPGMVKARLRALLEPLVPFDDVPGLLAARSGHPTLMCGAVDVLTGGFTVFEEACPDPDWVREHPDSIPEAVSIETVLASAAVPPLMPAVPIGHALYWDGLFAHNPPVRGIVDHERALRPEEIWVVQIDPTATEREPVAVADIVDRRFELSSNLSLNAELHWIRQVNAWIDSGILPADRFKTIDVARVQISPAMADRHDLAGKVDRDPVFLRTLAEEGERRMDEFLRHRAESSRDSPPEGPWWEPRFPHRYKPREG